MDKHFDKIWELAMPYLKQGLMKDFVLHTKYVVKAMELLIEGEGGDQNVLIPAAILHDTGFSKVDKELQTNADLAKKREAQRQHLIFAEEIVGEILKKLNYKQKDIDHITEIIQSHKFQDPTDFEKRMLIDADNLSDTFKEQFYSDVKTYGSTPEKIFEYRTQNTYYTKTAQEIAKRAMSARKAEIENI